MRSFITHYSNDNIQSPLPLMVADDPRQLTPVLVEAALCFDERVVPLYDLWSEEVLQEIIDRLDHPGDTAGNKLTPKEWEVLHAEIGCSILTGLNDTENLQDMEQWLLRDPSAPGLALRSAVSFLQGESERAIEQYEAALKLLRKETGKRNVVIPGIPVLFFALALIQQRHAGAPFERLFTEAVQIEKLHGDDPFTAVLRILGDFIRVACGEIKFKQSTWLTHEPVTDNPWLVLFQGLALCWLDERPGDRQIRRLLRHIDKALKNDLYWYAGEATALLERLGVDTDGIDYPFAGKPRQRLISLYQEKPRWEENLAALNLVTQRYGDGGTEGREQAVSDRRMVWWIQGEGSFVALEPRSKSATRREPGPRGARWRSNG